MEFTLDACFDGDLSNEELFYALQPTLVDHALAGFSSCFLCCGHTNAGKTHTVFGPPSDPGLALRCLDHFLQDGAVDVSLTFFEIYNENIYDLFGSNECTTTTTTNRKVRDSGAVDGLKIISDHEETNPGFYFTALQDALDRRARGGTWRNAQSSRSHAVFTITLTDRRTRALSQCCFVDLAGSERNDPAMSSVTKDSSDPIREQEAICINQSLSELAAVLSAIHQKRSYVNYRNSLLTRTLKEVLQSSRIVFNVALADHGTYSSTTHMLKYGTGIVRSISTTVPLKKKYAAAPRNPQQQNNNNNTNNTNNTSHMTMMTMMNDSSITAANSEVNTETVFLELARLRDDYKKKAEELEQYVNISSHVFDTQRSRIEALESTLMMNASSTASFLSNNNNNTTENEREETGELEHDLCAPEQENATSLARNLIHNFSTSTANALVAMSPARVVDAGTNAMTPIAAAAAAAPSHSGLRRSPNLLTPSRRVLLDLSMVQVDLEDGASPPTVPRQQQPTATRPPLATLSAQTQLSLNPSSEIGTQCNENHSLERPPSPPPVISNRRSYDVSRRQIGREENDAARNKNNNNNNNNNSNAAVTPGGCTSGCCIVM